MANIYRSWTVSFHVLFEVVQLLQAFRSTPFNLYISKCVHSSIWFLSFFISFNLSSIWLFQIVSVSRYKNNTKPDVCHLKIYFFQNFGHLDIKKNENATFKMWTGFALKSFYRCFSYIQCKYDNRIKCDSFN